MRGPISGPAPSIRIVASHDHCHPAPIITQARDLLANYDVLFCDVWGVIHDGFSGLSRCSAGADGVPPQWRDRRVVSNAPVPAHRVARMLLDKKVHPESWDGSSPRAPSRLEHVAQKKYEAVFAIGPRDGMLRSWKS